ncbi:hypothetical protein [Paenibacillus senegalimassiliensis]|uniref:hypothetical protein n=1 Tax=Paenibacillus senegalimassiliensis TaxID=1737426 RepID=UPI00073F307B|nr:hypothetical protein [Paenibacillus senegalimassiliensis]
MYKIKEFVLENQLLILRVLLGLTLFFLITSFVWIYNLLKEEDPRYTTYSCGRLFDVGSKKLTTEQKIGVSSSVSFKQEMNMISFMFETISLFSKKANIVNDTNSIISYAQQFGEHKKVDSFTIPENACYVSLDEGKIDYNYLNLPDVPRLQVYNWVKEYQNYLSEEYTELNLILIIDDNAIHQKSVISSNKFKGIEEQNIVYDINKND